MTADRHPLRWVRIAAPATLVVAIALVIGFGVGRALLPFALGQVLTAAHRQAAMTSAALGLLLVMILIVAAHAGQAFATIRATHLAASGLRRSLFRSLLRAPLQEVDGLGMASIAAKARAEVAAADARHYASITLLGDAAFLVALVPMVFMMSAPAGMAVVIVLPTLFLLIWLESVRAAPRMAMARRADVDLAASIAAALGEASVVRDCGRRQAQGLAFLGKAESAWRHQRLAARERQKAAILIDVVMGVVSAGALLLAARAISLGVLPVGALVAFALYTRRLAEPIRSLMQHGSALRDHPADHERIARILGLGRAGGGSRRRTPAGPLTVEIEDVSFGYDPRHPVLRQLSLVAQPGCVTVIMGPTGAGKSTVAQLLSRLYVPTSGEIRLGGVALGELDAAELARTVAVVPQEPWLFSGTVLENILCGRPGTREEAIRAAQDACADTFIQALPAGYDTPVRGAGAGLSTGQRQQICLARALLGTPRILVFDEATASLDAATEDQIRHRLSETLEDRVVLWITHRESPPSAGHRVVVLRDGGLVGGASGGDGGPARERPASARHA